MDNQRPYPYSGETGASVPDHAAYIGGRDSGGILRGFSVEPDGSLNVNVISGGASGGGTKMVDDAVFTPGTTEVTPAAGTYRTSRDNLDDGDAGAIAVTQKRAVLVSLETPAGDSAMDDTNDALKVVSVAAQFPVQAAQSGVWAVTANAGTNLNTSLLALESGGNLAALAASASVLDDWDESDRAKVNPIVGQAGVQGGAGAVSANTQRVVIATDQTAVPASQSGTWNIGTVTAVTAITNALPAGNNNIGDVDVASIAAGNNVIGQVKLTDGTDVADVLDLTNSNPLTVAIVDANGDQIASFGGGTQYTEDAAAAANPVGTAVNLIRQDTPAGNVTTDGDNVAQRGTNYGAAYVTLLDTSGNAVSVGGGTQYDVGDDVTAGIGTLGLFMRDDALSSLSEAEGDAVQGRVDSVGALWVSLATRIDKDNDSILIYGNTVKDGSGTDYVPLLDADGHQQVDVLSSALPTGAATLAEQQTQTASLSVIDDWDESDRAKVNLIVGQAGIAAGTGTDGATVPRVTLATNVPLPAGTNGIGKLTANSGVDIGDVDVTSLEVAAGATSIAENEDAAHTTGDRGLKVWGVANEANTARAADGDYLPHALDTEGNTRIVGNRDHDAVDAGEVVGVGGRTIAHGTNPTAVAAGDRSAWYFNRAGVPFVIGGHPNIITLEAAYTGAETNTAIITISTGLKIVVTQIAVLADKANTVDVGFRIGFATATTPTTTGVVLTHPGLAAGSGFSRGDGGGILGVGADNEDLRITSEVPTTGSIRVLVSYYTIES